MEYTIDLKKCTAPKHFNPMFGSVLFASGKIVATDSHRLIERDAEGEVNAIIPVSQLKKGDKLAREGEKVVITRADGSTRKAETRDIDDYPKYEHILNEAKERTSVTATFNRKYLIDLLQSMDSAIIELSLAEKDPHKYPLYVKGTGERGLLMPRIDKVV